MLKIKDKKTTTNRFQVTAIKAKTTYTATLLHIYETKWFHKNWKFQKKINEKTSNRILFEGKKNVWKQYQCHKKRATKNK